MQRSYLVPSYVTGEHGEAEALDVLGEILGGGTTSRLYRQLVVEKAVATSAGACYRGTALGDTQLRRLRRRRAATPRSRRSPATSTRVIAELVDKASPTTSSPAPSAASPPMPIYAQDSHAHARPRLRRRRSPIGQTVADVQNWPAAIDAVTADQT